MTQHIMGWNLFRREHLETIGNIRVITHLWRETSDEEKRVWCEEARMLDIFGLLSDELRTPYPDFFKRIDMTTSIPI